MNVFIEMCAKLKKNSDYKQPQHEWQIEEKKNIIIALTMFGLASKSLKSSSCTPAIIL